MDFEETNKNSEPNVKNIAQQLYMEYYRNPNVIYKTDFSDRLDFVHDHISDSNLNAFMVSFIEGLYDKLNKKQLDEKAPLLADDKANDVRSDGVDKKSTTNGFRDSIRVEVAPPKPSEPVRGNNAEQQLVVDGKRITLSTEDKQDEILVDGRRVYRASYDEEGKFISYSEAGNEGTEKIVTFKDGNKIETEHGYLKSWKTGEKTGFYTIQSDGKSTTQSFNYLEPNLMVDIITDKDESGADRKEYVINGESLFTMTWQGDKIVVFPNENSRFYKPEFRQGIEYDRKTGLPVNQSVDIPQGLDRLPSEEECIKKYAALNNDLQRMGRKGDSVDWDVISDTFGTVVRQMLEPEQYELIYKSRNLPVSFKENARVQELKNQLEQLSARRDAKTQEDSSLEK